jgi:anti-anti-sigma regulatory factor
MRRRSGVTSMSEHGEPRTLRLAFTAARAASFLAGVEQRLKHGPVTRVTIDFDGVERLDADALAVLAAAATSARAAGATVECESVRPPVYKALHVANLGALIVRAPRREGR